MGKSLESTKGTAWALLLTTHAVVVEQIEIRLAAAELPPLGWYDVLWTLERAKEQKLRMNELAVKVVLSRSNLTRLIDRLADAELVGRAQSEHDRRGAYAVLTEAGQAMRRKMWPTYQAAIRDLFEAHVSETEAAKMVEALRRVVTAAKEA